MLLGAMLAGQAFTNAPVGAVHGLAYPLGGFFHIPHGLSNALVLTEVMEYNLPKADHWYGQLARELKVGDTGMDLIEEMKRIKEKQVFRKRCPKLEYLQMQFPIWQRCDA